jgi:hypothetical protein
MKVVVCHMSIFQSQVKFYEVCIWRQMGVVNWRKIAQDNNVCRRVTRDALVQWSHRRRRHLEAAYSVHVNATL